jgi:phosphohistidine phosphatase
MKLYVFRHADAGIRDAEKYPDDTLRPLTKKGIKRIKKVARGLLNEGIKVDLILSSPALRTIDSAKIIRKELHLGKDKLVTSDFLLPDGNESQLITEIIEKYQVEGLAIVGHEPNMSMLISKLLSGDTGLSILMKKGGVCCLSLETLSDGKCATLEWLQDPKFF